MATTTDTYRFPDDDTVDAQYRCKTVEITTTEGEPPTFVYKLDGVKLAQDQVDSVVAAAQAINHAEYAAPA